MSNQNLEDESYFARILGVAHTEDLIRFRRRLEKKGDTRMAEVLTDEIAEREGKKK